MADELKVANCPGCGNVFQKNMRNLCSSCSSEEDTLLKAVETSLKRNRRQNNAELASSASIPEEKIHALIRSGKLKLYDYPNLADACDICAGPIRRGKLCLACATKIQDDIEHMKKQEELMKERLRAASNYISKK